MRTIIRILAAALTITLAIDASADARRRAVRISPPPDAQVTTFATIDRAAAEGRISPDEATLYKVFATYGDARLPQDLRGDDTGITDGTFMSEVAAGYASMPAAMQQQIAPFLIPPFHKGSWWELREQQARTFTTSDVVSYGIGPDKPCLDCPLSLEWEFAPTENGKVKVWYLASDVQAEARAKDFAFEIDRRIWPKLVALMGREPLPDDGGGFWLGAQMGGDSRLDIALVGIGRSVTTAIYDDCAHGAWSYIQFNEERPAEELAHEVMHAFQYAYNVKVRDANCTGEAEYRWLMESTAQWVIDYVYPTSTHALNEQWSASRFLDKPDKPLDFREDPHWYGAYLLPFFLARMKNQPMIVGEIWANTESLPSLDAFEKALAPLGGFEKVWPEFVLSNWNQGPVDHYEQLDQLKAVPAAGRDTFLAAGAMDKYAPLKAELPHLSASYKHFVFNERVRSVAFLNGLTYNLSTARTILNGAFDLGLQYKLTDVPTEQRRGVSVQAIVKRNGQWEEPEDWTNVRYKPFCRQKPEENIEEIVLIFANANHDVNSVTQPAGLLPLLIATDVGCRWEGTLDGTTGSATAGAWGPFQVRYDVRKEPRDPMENVDSFLGYSYTTSGDASWSAIGPAGQCTVNARADHVAIREDFAGYTMNFAPQNSLTYRKAWFPTGLRDEAKYSASCGVAGSFPVNASYQTFPSMNTLTFIGVGAEGMMTGSATDLLHSWVWDFKPRT